MCLDEENCEDCGGILEELEIIDGEADLFGIDMVKISDPDVAAKYNIISLPSLVYFRKRVPEIFDGKKKHEKKTRANNNNNIDKRIAIILYRRFER